MNFYRDLYFKLFAVIADAAEWIERGDATYAKRILIAAMREAEELYISAEEEA